LSVWFRWRGGRWPGNVWRIGDDSPNDWPISPKYRKSPVFQSTASTGLELPNGLQHFPFGSRNFILALLLKHGFIPIFYKIYVQINIEKNGAVPIETTTDRTAHQPRNIFEITLDFSGNNNILKRYDEKN
jgi:hypothetical protein